MDACAEPKLELKGKESKEDFLRLYKRCKNNKQARRYHAMYLSFSYNWNEMAEILGVGYDTVIEWAHLYNDYGLEGLELGRPPGRPSSLTSEQINEVKGAVKQCPRELGLKFNNWTIGRLADWVTVECKDLCPKSVQELMSTFGHSSMGDMDGESGYGSKIEGCTTFH